MHGKNATELGGGRLLRRKRALETKPGWFSRLVAGPGHKLVDILDERLARGSLHAILPDGSRRTLGGHADGFECTVHLRDWRALVRLATTGSQGWYQAWEAGEWDSPDPVPLFALFMDNAASLGDAARAKGPWRALARALHWLNRNTARVAERNVDAHYDLGNAFYAAWLDPTISYSSARFDEVDLHGPLRLERGQRRKWETLAERIGDAESVLEIGCGWGSLADHLARQGRSVTAISLADEQLAWAAANHSDGIDWRKQDYRAVSGQYDAIVSVEMVEAVGREFWPSWFDCLARNLKPGGRAAIQYIAIRDELFDAYAASADFIQAYIFPGGMLVSESAFRKLAAERGLDWRDQCDFGQDYAETLHLWRERFDGAVAKGKLPPGFDARFIDLWRYYLMYCEGGFRGGGITVSQVTLVKGE